MAEAVLGQALAAHKAGTLDELLRRRPRATRWFVRHVLQPVFDCAGDALQGPQAPVLAAKWLLAWMVSQLRPDGQAGLAEIDREAWLERTSWRPMLAVMCHYGFAPVREFRDRYHHRHDESAADHLCGLWNVGVSTFYRYLEKGKWRMAETMLDPHANTPARRMSLRHAVQEEVYHRLHLYSDEQRRAWHRAQAEIALTQARAPAVLWHLLQAGDEHGVLQALQRFRIELANHPDTDSLIERFAERAQGVRERFELALAQAALERIRGHDEREFHFYEQAQRIAGVAGDKLMLGVVAGALGKFHEARDEERAFVCYQDSAEFLRQAGLQDDPSRVDAQLVEEYVNTLVKLAWLYALRNDPRSKAVLERAQDLREQRSLSDETVALLEQSWGEYWRRAGDLRRALEHKHRALNMYERLGDQQSVLKTWGNLALIYADAKDFARAIDYSQKILALAEKIAVEPETVAATHLNLGGTYFWQGRYDEAIEQYQLGLKKSEQARLHVLIARAHYNLAEAFYKRYQGHERPEDEERGDAHSAAALLVWTKEGDMGAVEATRRLKSEILGPRDEPFYDRLLPGEYAAHVEEMSEVQRQQAVLALPVDAEQHVHAHLAISRAYLAISMKEREAALKLIHKHGLGDRFAAEFEELRHTFNRELTREEQLAAHWQQTMGNLLSDDRRAALLERLLHAGSISKSAYAQLCSVGLATASKHLGLLAERGLLVQTGKGPSTRYLLPPDATVPTQ
jgi:tetratricopeptide (TPR) repeat protein